MTDRPWKQFERTCAALFGGKRYPANSGGRVDVETPTLLVQCKQVKVLSLAELTRLCAEMAEVGTRHVDPHCQPEPKAGVVAVKLRQGAGRPTPTLVAMTAEVWQRLHPETVPARASQLEKAA